ncbi:sterol carrier family protein [Mariniluteicoccus flavus]
MAVIVQGPQIQKKAVANLLEQARHVAELLSTLSEEDFRRPTPHGQAGDVATLVAWLVVGEAQLIEALSTGTSARPVPIADFLLGDRLARHRKLQLARELAAHDSGRALATQFRQQVDEIASLMADPTVPGVVSCGSQPLRTVDLVRVTAIELLIIADDLAEALPDRSMERARGATADAVRALAEVVAHRHPGRSIELRVPPFAAVQCGTGDDPTHTRGTPPNVVEFDPVAFLRLAHGRGRFGDEVARGAVTASGTRSDLTDWFPIVG